MALFRTLAWSTATLVRRTTGTAGTPAATTVALLGFSRVLHRHCSSTAAIVSEPPTTNKTQLYTFQDMSEQEVLFAEMRHHRMSWGAIGKYFGKPSLEVFYGYIPIATRAYKHQWTSRMTEQDVLRCMEESNKP